MNRKFAVEVQNPLDPALESAVKQAIADNIDKKGPLLPILHQVQGELKHVPSECVPMIAKALNLSRAEVHGVISFYHTFTASPQGKYVIEVCRAESCQAMGGRTLEAKFQEALGISFGETTGDGMFSLEPVFCLGNCACSPSIRVGEDVYGRVTADKASALINELKSNSSNTKQEAQS